MQKAEVKMMDVMVGEKVIQREIDHMEESKMYGGMPRPVPVLYSGEELFRMINSNIPVIVKVSEA